MQSSLFLVNQLREKFLKRNPIPLNTALPQTILDIEEKKRSNLFNWRGQFSPQLVENLILAYAPQNATILDPFAGSGTVLYESGYFGLKAFGCELNPAAWTLNRIYELINLSDHERKQLITSLTEKLEEKFPKPKLLEFYEQQKIEPELFKNHVIRIHHQSKHFEKIILEALVILLDLSDKNPLTTERIHHIFYQLCQLIRDLPYSEQNIITCLGDARNLPWEADTIDFVITSPPYINVFNYHQNYRNSVELLSWDILKIAKSEIGSNRANRGNRFLTVIQYCLDIALVLKELQRVCQPEAKIILVVGYESNVLGVPFYNSKIISELVNQSNSFESVLTQERYFKNKFGKLIREDLLHLRNKRTSLSLTDWDQIARTVASQVLKEGLTMVSEQNKLNLIIAIEKIFDLKNSAICNPEHFFLSN